jgi:hypothetical protein
MQLFLSFVVNSRSQSLDKGISLCGLDEMSLSECTITTTLLLSETSSFARIRELREVQLMTSGLNSLHLPHLG